MHVPRRVYAIAASAALVTLGVVGASSVAAADGSHAAQGGSLHSSTATPIKHVVVIFDENVSFDHYFGTYPYATNTDGTTFHAKPGTPTVNGLYTTITSSGPAGPLLTSNPNSFNPQRLTHSEALTCDQNHGYTAEQKAVDNAKMDAFVQNTDTS